MGTVLTSSPPTSSCYSYFEVKFWKLLSKCKLLSEKGSECKYWGLRKRQNRAQRNPRLQRKAEEWNGKGVTDPGSTCSESPSGRGIFSTGATAWDTASRTSHPWWGWGGARDGEGAEVRLGHVLLWPHGFPFIMVPQRRNSYSPKIKKSQ